MGFQSRRQLLPLRMPKIRVARTGRQHQRVVGKPTAITQFNLPLIRIDADRLTKGHLDIAVLAQHRAQWCRDVGGRKRPRCNLIEQRLKLVKIAPINQSDGCGHPAKLPSKGQPAKAAPNDENPLRSIGHC
jgi:hypothetical protein